MTGVFRHTGKFRYFIIKDRAPTAFRRADELKRESLCTRSKLHRITTIRGVQSQIYHW